MRHASLLNSFKTALPITFLLSAIASHAQLNIEQAMLQQSARPSANAAITPEPPPQTTEEALHALAAQADVIFAGEVLTIRQETGVVAITWRILAGIRHVQTGEIFTQREWPGMWIADGARYRVGQRSLVLLHAESVAGLRTPVGGQDGVVPLNGDVQTGLTDLRWIALRQRRAPANNNGPQVQAQSAAPPANEPDLKHMDAAIVTGLLSAWSAREAQ